MTSCLFAWTINPKKILTGKNLLLREQILSVKRRLFEVGRPCLKGSNFCGFMFVSLDNKFQTGSSLNRKEFAPKGANSFS